MTSISEPATSAPYTAAMTSRSTPLPEVWSSVRASERSPKRTCGYAMAMWSITPRMRAVSALAERMNFRRAGMVEKSASTLTDVPGAAASVPSASLRPPSSSTNAADSAPAVRVTSRTCAAAAMLASASPRKPRDVTAARSSSERSLEVAWRSNASPSSSAAIPDPSSLTRMLAKPPWRTSTSTALAPASSAFSTSSLTTDAGRSMTSPAAIPAATAGGRTRITTPAQPQRKIERTRLLSW